MATGLDVVSGQREARTDCRGLRRRKIVCPCVRFLVHALFVLQGLPPKGISPAQAGPEELGAAPLLQLQPPEPLELPEVHWLWLPGTPALVLLLCSASLAALTRASAQSRVAAQRLAGPAWRRDGAPPSEAQPAEGCFFGGATWLTVTTPSEYGMCTRF